MSRVDPTPHDPTAPPTVPDRTNRTSFASQMYAFFTWMAGSLYNGIVNLANDTYTNALDAYSSANAAASSASAASTSESAAAASALSAVNAPGSNATCASISTTLGGGNSSIAAIVSAGVLYATLQTGKSFFVGQMFLFADSAGSAAYVGVRTVSYDPSTGAYHGSVVFSEGAGSFTAWTVSMTTDPTKLTPRVQPIVTAGAYAALAGYTYIIAGAHNATLPAAPQIGDTVSFRNESGTTGMTVGRNGLLIESQAADMTIDLSPASFSLVYTGTTYGWIVA